MNLGLHSMRSGGATAVSNASEHVSDRCWKRHGRWKSDTSKDGYVVDSLEKRLNVSKHLGILTIFKQFCHLDSHKRFSLYLNFLAATAGCRQT